MDCFVWLVNQSQLCVERVRVGLEWPSMTNLRVVTARINVERNVFLRQQNFNSIYGHRKIQQNLRDRFESQAVLAQTELRKTIDQRLAKSDINRSRIEKHKIRTKITFFCVKGPGQSLLILHSFVISAILVAEERNLVRAKFGNEEQNYDKIFVLHLSV